MKQKAKEKGGHMSPINWLKDVDAAFKQAKSQNKPVLLDFSAAPA